MPSAKKPVMYTGTYWPKDYAHSKVYWTEGDVTAQMNGFAYLEGPNYCVRLLVFEMPEDE